MDPVQSLWRFQNLVWNGLRCLGRLLTWDSHSHAAFPAKTVLILIILLNTVIKIRIIWLNIAKCDQWWPSLWRPELRRSCRNPATNNLPRHLIHCWSPNVTRSVVMVSWFTRNYCACAPMLYISELCIDCPVAKEIDCEIDYAWALIHDNGHVITACDVWLQQCILRHMLQFWQRRF